MLRDLWRMRACELASNVALGSRAHREIAHSASQIGTEYRDRVLVELLQNANDQALLGGEPDSTVLIVRTNDLVAVSNAGQRVTKGNLERLSSLADSDKTGNLVGNKGVGFKAVYQVTDKPEIYSTSEDATLSEVQGFGASGGLRFSLERRPLSNQSLVEAIEKDIREYLENNVGIAQALLRLDAGDPLAPVRAEYQHVAGFKFPLPLNEEVLASRLTELRLDPADLPLIRTLVVLPLRDQAASDDIDRLLDRLVDGQGHAEFAVLFLPGISTIKVFDHARNRRWEFSRTTRHFEQEIHEVSVKTKATNREEKESRYWILNQDIYACSASLASERRAVVAAAIDDFGLEAWLATDPLSVTVAVPTPDKSRPGVLGPAGRFCLGLPTERATGLPVHVDARFFAKISREGIDFSIAYNAVLLDVAASLLGRILDQLRRSSSLDNRRASTLVLHRTAGELADRVYAAGGIADMDVVLAWGGEHFISRRATLLPDGKERELLRFIRGAPVEGAASLVTLPEAGLLEFASEALETMGLRPLRSRPHPWLESDAGSPSTVEISARKHRSDGPSFWEGFVNALLDCFDPSQVREQVWLPIGSTELAAPVRDVFLPASADVQGDEDEIQNVPPGVAALIRLLDPSAMRLRQGRAYTSLGTRLTEARLVHPPRKADLLERAIFPELEQVSTLEDDLALAMFAQAISWIASMKELSQKRLDCKRARVPVRSPATGGIAWVEATRAYIGTGWGLEDLHDRLLATAYPDRRLVPLAILREQIPTVPGDSASWLKAATVLGVKSFPRVLSYATPKAPLQSLNGRLEVLGTPSLGNSAIDATYTEYVSYLSASPTTWRAGFPHDVTQTLWVEGLETAPQREAVLDLMLMDPAQYLLFKSVQLCRVGHSKPDSPSVDAMWVFALSRLNWPIFSGERGAGKLPIRVSAGQLWRLPEGARKTGYAHIVDVVPHSLSPASALLAVLGVASFEDATLGRLFEALSQLSDRLDTELMHSSAEALSLAKEIYHRIDERLLIELGRAIPTGIRLPLLRNYRLEAVDPADPSAIIVFDDEPARARFIKGLEDSFRVPISRDSIERIYLQFATAWGSRVVRTSTAAVDLGFRPTYSADVGFLQWLEDEYPRSRVVAELAALLTFSGERSVKSEPISRNWKLFERLKVVIGSFDGSEATSFYDRPTDRLLVDASLKPHQIVASTWELAGGRARDLWVGFSMALQENRTRSFLGDRDIGDVEIVSVADAAQLHQVRSIQGVACALHAAKCYLTPGTTLEEAAVWLSSLGEHPIDVASAFSMPELETVLAAAVLLRPPEGELKILRFLQVPWALWQEAVKRRDGKKYAFAESIQRFNFVRFHLIAVAREIGAKDVDIDLESLEDALLQISREDVPDAVKSMPLNESDPDLAALRLLQGALAAFPSVSKAFSGLVSPRLTTEPPIPSESTLRGVQLYRDTASFTREIEARTSVAAVVHTAVKLAAQLGEDFDDKRVLANSRLTACQQGDWAHVYVALYLVRMLLEPLVPETVKRLSAIRAFRDPSTIASLVARLPELESSMAQAAPPTQTLMGLALTATQVASDLSKGAEGALGALIAQAVADAIDPAILNGVRAALPVAGAGAIGHSHALGKPGSGSRKTYASGIGKIEPAIIGDLGEAFMHEWLSNALGAGYGPECWISKSRERYGFPPCGEDSAGYDFKVSDPGGRLFGRPCHSFLIEVKSTSTDGTRSFPMSRSEWEVAMGSHDRGSDEIYAIVRVFHADSKPRIGDVLIDPVALSKEGRIHLADRDMWVTVSPSRES